jgi:hypothetical protein
VPLILAGPGVPRGVRSTVPVSNRQLAWTLARRGGGSLPAVPRPVDLAAPERVEPRPLFFSTEHGWWWNEARTTILGVEDWPWVLHSIPRGLPWGAAKGADPGEGEVRLYDLEADPGERRDLSKERSDLVEPLLRALVDHTRKSLAARTGRVRSVGDATLDLLRRFGYAGDPGESPRERR